MAQRYYLDRNLIIALLHRKGWGQLTLAVEAELGLRVVHLILSPDGYVCTRLTAEKIAAALGVNVDEIACGWLSAWQAVPDISDKRLANLMRRAVRDDMNGEHERAAAECGRVLSELSPEDEPESYPLIAVKLITFLSHAGRIEEALDEVEHMMSLPGVAQSSLAMLWAQYQKGIALRRLGDFAEARATLEALRNHKNPFSVSALHQLGAVDVEEAKACQGEDREVLLDRALDHLGASLDEWENFGRTHRKGFSLQRMAEVAVLRGETRRAFELYEEALVVFAWEHCKRYCDGVRKDLGSLRDYLADPGGDTRSTPTAS